MSTINLNQEEKKYLWSKINSEIIYRDSEIYKLLISNKTNFDPYEFSAILKSLDITFKNNLLNHNVQPNDKIFENIKDKFNMFIVVK